MNKTQSNEHPTFQEGGVSLKRLSPLKAIRAKCLDCTVYQPKEVKLCSAIDCDLYIYRFGRNPVRKGMGNPLAFAKKVRAKSVTSLSASVANVNASVASTQINSSAQLMKRKEK